MCPELFHIPFPFAAKGHIPIFAYGFMIMLGFVFSILYAAWRAKKEGEDPNHVLDVGLYAVVSGILGSRLFYYVEFYDEHFADRPWYVMFFIWEGGLVFYGGLIAATVVILAFLRAKRLPVLKFADILAAAVPIGLAFARIGCTLNGCCWGRVDKTGRALLSLQFPRNPVAGNPDAHSPAWLAHFKAGLIPQTMGTSLPVHATQLYEWAAAVILAAILFFYYRRHRRHGQVFAALWVLYGPVRYVIEAYREHHPAERMLEWSLLWDPLAQDYMTKSQVVSLLILVFGAALWAWFTARGERYTPTS